MGSKRKTNNKKKTSYNAIQKMNNKQLTKNIPPKLLAEFHEKARKEWAKALLSHYIVFNLYMDDEKMCHALFKIILKNFNISLNKLTITTEKTIQDKGKGIRLDVLVQEEKHTIAVEMQGKIKYMPPKRLRNYFVTLDKDQLIKGQNHTDLKDTFIIVVTPEDPFGLGEPIYIVSKEAKPLKITKFKEGEFNLNDYTEDSFNLEKAKKSYNNTEKPEKPVFKNSLKEKDKTTEFDDGTYIIYLNASAYKKVENDELRAFLAYIMGEHLTNIDFFYVVHERFKKVKYNKEMESDFMLSAVKEYYYELQKNDELMEKAMEKAMVIANKKSMEKAMVIAKKEVREDVIKEVREDVVKETMEKAHQEKVNVVLNMIKQNLSDEIISKCIDFTMEEITEIREGYSKQ